MLDYLLHLTEVIRVVLAAFVGVVVGVVGGVVGGDGDVPDSIIINS